LETAQMVMARANFSLEPTAACVSVCGRGSRFTVCCCNVVHHLVRTTKYLVGVLIILSILLAGCGERGSSGSPVAPGAPILKIAVFADGRITADGQPATIDALRSMFKKLAEEKGAVWYYRETGKSEPPPQAMEVIKAVTEARLPIRLSSRPDYSDAIGMDGKPLH
jgi:hypothetical protein